MRRAWWILIDNGSSMWSARGRRRVWRADKRAAELVREGDKVGETQRQGEQTSRKRHGEGEREKGRPGTAVQTHRTSSCLCPPTATATAAATAAAPEKLVSVRLISKTDSEVNLDAQSLRGSFHAQEETTSTQERNSTWLCAGLSWVKPTPSKSI